MINRSSGRLIGILAIAVSAIAVGAVAMASGSASQVTTSPTTQTYSAIFDKPPASAADKFYLAWSRAQFPYAPDGLAIDKTTIRHFAINGTEVIVAKDATGRIVLSVSREDSDRVTTTAATLDEAAVHPPLLSITGPETGDNAVLAGVVPDGVGRVSITGQSGDTQSVSADGVFAARGSFESTVRWDTPDGRGFEAHLGARPGS